MASGSPAHPEHGDPARAEGAAESSDWRAWMPLALIVFVLMSMVLLPWLVDRRTESLRAEIRGVAEPARALVSEAQFALAREMAAVRGYLLTRDARFLDRFRRALDAEARAYRGLEPLAQTLGPDVQRRLDTLRALSDRWHGRVTAGEVLDPELLPEELDRRIPFDQEIYEQTLEASRALEAAIIGAAERRSSAIARAERIQAILTVVLVLIAIAAALVVGWLYRRVGLLAAQLRRRAREETALRRQVERLMEGKARMIRGFSHDVKNPLGAADGYAQLLADGVLGPMSRRQRDAVGRIREVIRGALGIIDDLVELSRAEAGELEVKPEPTDLAEIVRDAASDYGPSARGAGLGLRLRTPRQPLIVPTDPARVHQVLGNLLSNAIKYTPVGGEIVVELKAPDADGRVAVHVSDSGPGIPPEKREHIFEEFSRLDSRARHGAGLGLAISRRIARVLGGDITVASESGEGSTFTLWLPTSAPATRETRRAAD